MAPAPDIDGLSIAEMKALMVALFGVVAELERAEASGRSGVGAAN